MVRFPETQIIFGLITPAGTDHARLRILDVVSVFLEQHLYPVHQHFSGDTEFRAVEDGLCRGLLCRLIF